MLSPHAWKKYPTWANNGRQEGHERRRRSGRRANLYLYLTKSAPCALASHSATSPLFKHRQISIERPKLSIAAAVSRAFWSLPVLALPASIFSGQLGILPLSQPSVAHLPPPAAPLAAAPLRTRLAARETRAKVEGTSQLLGTSSPTHRQEKRSSSTVRRGGKDQAAARPLLLNGAVGVGHTDNDAGTELQSASNWRMQRGESISCDLYRYMLISLALKFCKFLVYLATRSHRQVMFGRPARVPPSHR